MGQKNPAYTSLSSTEAYGKGTIVRMIKNESKECCRIVIQSQNAGTLSSSMVTVSSTPPTKADLRIKVNVKHYHFLIFN